MTLQQLDEMLEKYETNAEMPCYKENKNFETKNKISQSTVYHLVHNNNNRNDNTLKRKNALVTFEFKKIISTVQTNIKDESTCVVDDEEKKLILNKNLVHLQHGLYIHESK